MRVMRSNVINVFFFKQKTAYEMRISDWSSDVCSSDLPPPANLWPCRRNDWRKSVKSLSGALLPIPLPARQHRQHLGIFILIHWSDELGADAAIFGPTDHRLDLAPNQNGRASGRERVCQSV